MPNQNYPVTIDSKPLYCFANDVIIAYGNNQGSIQLTVAQITS